MIPNLRLEAKRILRSLKRRGTMSGNEIRHEQRFVTMEQMVETIRPLVERGIVSCSRDGLVPDEAAFCFYDIMPSARRLADFLCDIEDEFA